MYVVTADKVVVVEGYGYEPVGSGPEMNPFSGSGRRHRLVSPMIVLNLFIAILCIVAVVVAVVVVPFPRRRCFPIADVERRKLLSHSNSQTPKQSSFSTRDDGRIQSMSPVDKYD